MIIEADDIDLIIHMRVPGRDYRRALPGDMIAPDGMACEQITVEAGNFALIPGGAEILLIREAKRGRLTSINEGTK
ncbi:MAG: hypothetical protein ACOYB0_08235 [Polynucleobacter sp.]